jgi:hypothetical protein
MIRRILLLRHNLAFIYKKCWLYRLKYEKNKWVFSRVACLGKDVIKILKIDFPIFNLQKGRSDYIVNSLNHKNITPKVNIVSKYMLRKDIIPMLFQQKLIRNVFKLHEPEFIFIDSFSELTDQQFIHKIYKWMFNINYTDINIKHPKIWSQFKCNGLLPDSEIEENYKKFFNKLRRHFGDIPIIFIHYPSKLDQREKFIKRSEVIKKSISKLKPSFEPFYDIYADNAVVDFCEDDKFPYHYSDKTYKNIASKIMALDIFKDSGNGNV